jgi:hypothetical protein
MNETESAILSKTSSQLTHAESLALPSNVSQAVLPQLILTVQNHWEIKITSGLILQLQLTGRTLESELSPAGEAQFNNIPYGTMLVRVMEAAPSKRIIEVLNNDFSAPGEWLALTLSANTSNILTYCITILAPPRICNFRADADPTLPGSDGFLTAAEIDMIQRTGNSITLFVHGFNVPPGEWGRYIQNIVYSKNFWRDIEAEYFSLGMPTSKQASSVLATTPCTVRREPKQLQQQFPEFDPTPPQSDPWLSDEIEQGKFNATEAYHWLLQLEHYLNQVAGFDGKHYQQFRRLLLILWQGDPKNPADYMSAVGASKQAGASLSLLLQQLIAAGIKINVIAHSLGNAVLLTALNNLGLVDVDRFTAKVEHVFLWDAAVPNDTLFDCQVPKNIATDPTQLAQVSLHCQRNRWFLPYAMCITKKVTVLYSQNDNVLGPIPKTQTMGLTQAMIESKKPLLELVTALLLNLLDVPSDNSDPAAANISFHSVYDLAMWIGVPATDLLNREIQEKIYQAWRQAHQPTADYQKTVESFENPFLSDRFRDQIKHNQQLGKQWAANFEDQIKIDSESDRSARFFKQLEYNCHVQLPLITQRLQAAGYGSTRLVKEIAIVSWVFKHLLIAPVSPDVSPRYTISDFIFNMVAAFFHLKGLITLVTTIFYDTPYQPQFALGYSGPDPLSAQQLGDKLTLVDQTTWLFSHSAMCDPTPEIVAKSYQQMNT